MKLISCTETETNRRKLEIAVEAAEFAAAVEKAYKKNVGKINVPGFRKGKAPRNIIERMYGKEFFFEEAVNDIYPVALNDAIKEAGLEYVEDEIDLDAQSVSLEEGVVFTAVITVKPEVKLSGYKGIAVERPVVNVTDAQIDGRIDQLRERNARIVDVDDRAAKDGDITTIDFEGFVDGVAFDGGKAEGYELTLGSGSFIPGFEEQIVGHSIGEEFDVNVNFPEEYHAEELKGKPAVFKIKLHAIKEKQLPEVDDDFVTEVSEDCDTVDQLRESIRKEMTADAEKKADAAVEDRLFDWLTENMECEIPAAMFENRIDQNMRDFEYRLQAQGISLEQYMTYLGGSVEEMREQMKPNSERQVRVRLALESIVKQEGIEVSEEETEKEIANLAEQYRMSADEVRKAIDPEGLRMDLAVDKAIAIIKESAVITDEKPAE